MAPIPRLPFAAICAVASCAAVTLGVLVASQAGGAGETLFSIAGVLIVASALCLIPLIGPPLVTPERWGIAVMLASGARTMVALFALLVLIEVHGAPRRPVVFGVLTGVTILMTAEAVAAVWLLSRRERLKADSRDSHVSRRSA